MRKYIYTIWAKENKDRALLCTDKAWKFKGIDYDETLQKAFNLVTELQNTGKYKYITIKETEYTNWITYPIYQWNIGEGDLGMYKYVFHIVEKELDMEYDYEAYFFNHMEADKFILENEKDGNIVTVISAQTFEKTPIEKVPRNHF